MTCQRSKDIYRKGERERERARERRLLEQDPHTKNTQANGKIRVRVEVTIKTYDVPDPKVPRLRHHRYRL
jgi:hypothetical protein